MKTFLILFPLVILFAFSSFQTQDGGKGIGPVKSVALSNPLDPAMIARAQPIFATKCAVCHKMTAEKSHGPGWLGITKRRQPEWIMNMIVNPTEMLAQDSAAKQLATQFLIKMPDQKVTVDQARDILELMRSNDGEK